MNLEEKSPVRLSIRNVRATYLGQTDSHYKFYVGKSLNASGMMHIPKCFIDEVTIKRLSLQGKPSVKVPSLRSL